MFNKLFKNGYRLGCHYSCGIKHLNAQSSSSEYKMNLIRFHTRSMASLLIWYRICYNLKGASWWSRMWAALSFVFKSIWLLFVHAVSSFWLMSPRVLSNYIRGLCDGLKKVQSVDFQQRPNYIIEKK